MRFFVSELYQMGLIVLRLYYKIYDHILSIFNVSGIKIDAKCYSG